MSRLAVLGAGVMLALSALTQTSEIKVSLKLDGSDFIVGERIRGVVDIANSSSETVGIGGKFNVWGWKGSNRVVTASYDVNDKFFIEVYRASDMHRLTKVSKSQFVSSFAVESSEGLKLEVFLGDHFGLQEPSRYLAKPVFVHNGMRYEGAVRAFDVVEGVKIVGAMQLFKNRPGLQREFSLSYWSRNHSEHLFLSAFDSGTSKRRWETRDLGAILRIDSPSISVLPTGEVVVLHRLDMDNFVRSELWSLPDALEFRRREVVRDPETAGTARVRELYKEGGVKPKVNPWWKFW